MNFTPGNLYHLYNQGNNRQKIFTCSEEYHIFLMLVRRNILPNAEIICWCLMPNHFHFMIYADERIVALQKQGGLQIDSLTNGIRKLLSGYARIYNQRHGHSGSLFRQKTKSKCLTDAELMSITRADYYFNCFHYIHQNPVVARLVKELRNWPFSSYCDYANLRNGTLCNKTLATKYCSYEPDTFVRTSNNIIEGFNF